MMRLTELPRFALYAIAVVLCLLSAQVSHAATIDVTNDCELPAAIIAANTDSNQHDTDCTAGSGADTLNMSAVASPYVLSAAMAAITSDITIEGHGKTIHGNDTYRIFNVASSGRLTLNRVTLERGEVGNTEDGGAILNAGRVTITKSTIQNGEAGYGAGIASSGSLTIISSTLASNTASSDGGGIYIFGGSATINNSAIGGNNAQAGGGIRLESGSLTVATVPPPGRSASASPPP